MPRNWSSQEIEEVVVELAAEHGYVDRSVVRLDSHFETDLNYDSLGIVEFTMDLEERFEIAVPDDRAAEVRTVRDAMRLVGELLGHAPAGNASIPPPAVPSA